MMYVVNKAFGSFKLPENIATQLNTWVYDDSEEIRTSPILIDYLNISSKETSLEVVEVPDNATDYDLKEYDGFETIVYVVDGKLNWV